MDEFAIRARGLGKRYGLGELDSGLTRLRRALGLRGPREWRWAIADLDFDILAGEKVALIGRNGAGKSTLLKVLSRITEPTAGYADVCGRVGSLLEVGTGFHPQLTGRQNVFLNGAILGMRRRDVLTRFDDIVEFAGVGAYLDTPVRWYSSGMFVRLGFAVAAHLDPEILIVDEVLAVGDAEFQRRCLGRMNDVAREGRTVLFVSHNMQTVRRLCDRALLLEDGHIAADGDTETVIRRYLADLDPQEDGRRTWSEPNTRPGDELCRVVEVRATDSTGAPAGSFFTSRPIIVTIEFDLAASPDSSFTAGFDLSAADSTVVFRSYFTDAAAGNMPRLGVGRNAIQCAIPAGLLNTGRYVLNLRIGLHWTRWIVHDDGVLNFDVVADHGESLFLNDTARPGVIAPILPWVAVEPSSGPDEALPQPAQISASA